MGPGVDIEHSRRGLRLRGPGLLLDVRFEDRCLAFAQAEAGRRVLPRCFAAVELAGGGEVSSVALGFETDCDLESHTDRHGSATLLRLRTPPSPQGARLILEAALYDDQPFAMLRLGLANEGPAPLRPERLLVVTTPGVGRGRPALGGPVGRWRFYRQGWQSWTPTLALQARDRAPPAGAHVLAPFPADIADRRRFVSEEVGVVEGPAGAPTLLLGFVTAKEQITRVVLNAGRRAVEAVAHAEGLPLAPGEMLWSERLMVDLTGPAMGALARYGEALGREMGARVPQSAPTGWCSWYRYFWNIGEEEVLQNLAFLAGHRRELPLEFVQLDDGYETDIGDWRSIREDRFPHSLPWLARRTREAGFQPGLWVAPFIVTPTSRLFAEHPDWVVRDDEGRPVVAMHNWQKDCYALDCTHPEALRWLDELFREIGEGWGFDFLKVDFIFAGAVAGRRHDRQATRVQAFRRGLETIRRAVGERFVLGCGTPIGPSVGLVDGMRIGPDVGPWWYPLPPPGQPRRRRRRPPASEPAMANALRNVLTRSWMHGRLWANDPDCLLVRDTNTTLTLDEVQAQATAVALCGGMLLDSDDLTALPPERLEMISLLLPPYGRSAVPSDLMDEPVPRVFELEVERPFESWRLVGLFNWADGPRDLALSLPAGSWHVFELWERRYHGLREGDAAFPAVPAHGARLVCLRRPQAVPQLLSTTFHFGQGAVEVEDAAFDAEAGVLRVSLLPVAKERGELLLHAPATYRPAGARVDGVEAPLEVMGGGVLRLPLSVSSQTKVEVEFRHV